MNFLDKTWICSVVVVDFLFIVTPIVGVCNCSVFCCTLLYVHSSIAIILMGKRKLIALLNLSSWCLVIVERLFLAVPRGCLQFVIVVFPDHTHLLFLLQLDYGCLYHVALFLCNNIRSFLSEIFILLYFQNSELISLADESRGLKDELDVLRHTAEQVVKYEAQIESYKKKMGRKCSLVDDLLTLLQPVTTSDNLCKQI